MKITEVNSLDLSKPGFQWDNSCNTMYIVDSSGCSWMLGGMREHWTFVESPEHQGDAVGVIDAITRLLSVSGGNAERRFKPRQEESEHGRWE